MPKYIALLRGINVSGVKIIKMEDLKGYFSDMGFRDVKTYIQSGNVVFEANKQTVTALTKKITKGLEEALGYHVPVVTISTETMQEIQSADVFTNVLKSVPTAKKYVAFLERPLTKDEITYLHSLTNEVDVYYSTGNEIYITIDETKGKSLYTNMLLEKKLKIYATTRNWNTVCKLASM